MAVPSGSNTSPSLVSTRTNLNPRNSESNSAIRRSFSSNPFARPSVLSNPRNLNPVTPANSPADFTRRQSVGKEGVVSSRGFEEKENGQDQNLKAVKIRSPAKNTRNFMSPTISAASKFTPSPKKKVLAERNVPVRTSISLSDAKGTFGSVNPSDVRQHSDTKSDMGLEQAKTESSDHTTVDFSLEEAASGVPMTSEALKEDTSSQVPLHSKSASELLSETIYDCVNDASTTKNKSSRSLESPIIAPLDADPSLPPYDPKTNYLSPRPQFLHYRPKPRIEVLLNKEKGIDVGKAKQLDDSFEFEIESENFSDTTEEVVSEESLKDSEDASSGETILEEESDQEVKTSEPSLPISSAISNEMLKGSVEPERVVNQRFFTSSKTISLIFVLLVTCISIWITHCPAINSSVVKSLNFYKLHPPSEVAAFAKANIDGLTRNLKQWSVNSFSYLSKRIPILVEVDTRGPIQFYNLSNLQEEFLIPKNHWVHNSIVGPEENYQQNELEPDGEGVEMEETVGEKDYYEVHANGHGKEPSAGEDNSDDEEVHHTQQDEVNETDSNEVWIQEQSNSIVAELQSGVYPEDQPVLRPSQYPEVKHESEVIQEKHEAVETQKLHCETVPILVDDSHERSPGPVVVSKGDDSQALEVSNSSIHRLGSKFSETYSLGIISLALPSAVAIAFLFLKQRRTTSPNVASSTDLLLSKKQTPSPIAASTKHYQEKPFSENWPAGVNFTEESCPSEMSSFQKSSSCSKKVLEGSNEAQSQERKPEKRTKRESFASSSESLGSSPSYGSFTTYEKIPSKNGTGDEEVMTPVRRSNRIRKQVTSP